MFLFFLGSIMIVLGFTLLFLPSQSKEKKEKLDQNQMGHGQAGIPEEKAEVKGGAVIMLGPIPIIVGSDSKTVLLIMLLSLALMILWFLILKGA